MATFQQVVSEREIMACMVSHSRSRLDSHCPVRNVDRAVSSFEFDPRKLVPVAN